MEVIRERILATANGDKVMPFRDTFSGYVGAMRRSQMSVIQQRSLFIAKVVLHAIEKYKFI